MSFDDIASTLGVGYPENRTIPLTDKSPQPTGWGAPSSVDRITADGQSWTNLDYDLADRRTVGFDQNKLLRVKV